MFGAEERVMGELEAVHVDVQSVLLGYEYGLQGCFWGALARWGEFGEVLGDFGVRWAEGAAVVGVLQSVQTAGAVEPFLGPKH